MISFGTYKVIHLLGVMMLFLSLGGGMLYSINGGKKDHRWRIPSLVTHGLGMIFTLVGGFGLLARLGIVSEMPSWVIIKLVIWLIFGAWVALIYRKPALMPILWWVILILGAVAAYLGGEKPFLS